MKTIRILGVALLAMGTFGLVYGGFNYTKATHEAHIGPIRFSVKEQERFNVPVWAGVMSIAVGGILLLYAGRRR